MADINGIPYVESSDLVSAYPAVSQSLAQEVSDQLASKVDYALPTNAQTGTAYTFVAADAEKLTTASNGSAVTLTIPPASSVAWPDETILRVVNYGAGAVTIDGGSGVTVTNTSSTIAQYGAAVAIRTGSDAWTVVPFGGGDVPPATVSSPAATGQYTDGSGDTWDYYTFTSSGTLTVDTAGLADVLVIGGGGGGGAGGGGAGGHVYLTDVYLSAASHTVTVGAGGGGVSGGSPSVPGNTSFIGPYFSPGGGGGGGRGQHGGSGSGAYNTSRGNGTSTIGNDGGIGSNVSSCGGGGGAGAAGADVVNNTNGAAGGNGLANSITGSSVTRAGGGGGAGSATGGAAGSGGATAGTPSGGTTSATANTGSGAGGTFGGLAGNGGSGVVIVRVKV